MRAMCIRISAEVLDRAQQGAGLAQVHRLDKTKRHCNNRPPAIRAKNARIDVGKVEVWLQGDPGLTESKHAKRIKKLRVTKL